MNNLYSQNFQITRPDYEKMNGHKSFVIWLTGLSGSGKSTIANGLNKKFFANNFKSIVLDGDNIRLGINNDLGFNHQDRAENIRRVAEIAKLSKENGQIVITSFISPFETDRKRAKDIISSVDFIEVFIDCALNICEKRDVKDLYRKARNGEINDFTGISSPYEKPKSPDIMVNSEEKSINESIDYIFKRINELKCLNID